MIRMVVILLSLFSLIPSLALAGGLVPAPPPSAPPVQTLQTTGQQAMQQNDGDGNAAAGMAGGFAAAAVAYASSHQWTQAALYGAAGWLGGTIVADIMKKKGDNKALYDAVTVGGGTPTSCALPPCDSTTPGNPGGPADGSGNPVDQGYLTNMKKLKDMGVSFDPKTGVVTTPGGTFKTGDMSPGALKAGGFSDKDIAAFNAKAAEIKAKAEAAAKGADANSDLFGDSIGGSGSAGTHATAAVSAGIPTGPRAGVDRNPAQVAGMSRTLNGEPIGVSADDMFKMMNRRYDLHEKNGSFLAP